MPDQLDLPPLVQLIAFKPFWSVFLPDDGEGQDDAPNNENRAQWLSDFLNLWSWHVERFVKDLEAEEQSTPFELGMPESESGPILQLLLGSLGNAADALLAFKRRYHLVEVPEMFSTSANLLLGLADRRRIRTKDLTVSQIAMRLAALNSHLSNPPRPVRIDERGRVFDPSGERLFQFEPDRVLKAKQQIKDGRVRSLEEFREAEARNGR